MKKAILMFYILLSVSLIFLTVIYAEDVETVANELSAELRKDVGLTENERKSIEGPVKDMLRGGTKKEDIKKTVSGLKKSGIKDEELRSSVESMNELVKKGKSAKEAGNIVSQAAHQAKSEGLKGKDLANRVHQAVEKMQMQNRQEKAQHLQNTQKPHKEGHSYKLAPEYSGREKGVSATSHRGKK